MSHEIKPNTIYNMDLFDLSSRISDQSIDMILCDLPYGMTNCGWDTVIPLGEMWQAFKRIIKPNGAIVLTATQPFTSMLVASNFEMYRHNWVWDKNRAPNFLNCNREPMRQHEDVLVFSQESVNYYPQMVKSETHRRGGSKNRNNGQVYGEREPVNYTSDEKYPKTILNIPTTDNAQKLHPTQKPVKLFEYLIRTYTRESELVFDPCVGSGTTALACRRSKRNYICGDLSPEYCEVAQNRVGEKLTFEHSEDESGIIQLNLFAEVAYG